MVIYCQAALGSLVAAEEKLPGHYSKIESNVAFWEGPMNLTQVIAFYAAFLSTLVAAWNIYVYSKERYKLVIEARYIPEAVAYILEITNTGRKEITVTAASVARAPQSYLHPEEARIWQVQGTFPCRIKDGDSAYVAVPWKEELTATDEPTYAWARDARGRTYRAPLPDNPSPMTITTAQETVPELTNQELARLFNLAKHRDEIRYWSRRLAVYEIEVETIIQIAKMRKEEKARKKSETGSSGTVEQVETTIHGSE